MKGRAGRPRMKLEVSQVERLDTGSTQMALRTKYLKWNGIPKPPFFKESLPNFGPHLGRNHTSEVQATPSSPMKVYGHVLNPDLYGDLLVGGLLHKKKSIPRIYGRHDGTTEKSPIHVHI